MDLREVSANASQRHPWEISRMRFFTRALRHAGLLASTERMLDVGAGDAWFASQVLPLLPVGAHIDCVDSEYSDENLTQPGLTNLQLHQRRPAGRYELIVLLDVLEHVRDDLSFLTELVDDALDESGHVLISVPAWPSLFTARDTFLHHHRRYTPKTARELIAEAGLRIETSGGLFHSLLLPRAIEKARERIQGPATHGNPGITWERGAVVTGLVQAALAVDNATSAWLARAGVPAPGLSWWALCRK